MGHLTEHYGSFDHIQVQCEIKTDNCCVADDERFFKNGFQHEDFLKFPELHGWTVDSSTYHLKLNGTQRSGPDNREHSLKNPEEFVQSWLFFFLITCVVRTDRPLLKFSDLTGKPVETAKDTFYKRLHTGKLETALTRWHRWAKENRQESKLRLIQSDLILELARQVVRANLAEGATCTPKLEVTSKTSLAIMILGETLSAAKLEVMESMGAKVRGWHEDDNEGWGDSEYVSEHIEDLKFCPHVAKTLKVQMGSNVTLLLAATKHYPGTKDHGPACREAEKCSYISASEPTSLGPKLNDVAQLSPYQPQCHKPSSTEVKELCERGECSMVGPDMNEVYNILKNVDHNDEGSQFPLFRIKKKTATEMEVLVEEWPKAGRRPDFATISHVWSQGLGNEDRNLVHQCQLFHIARLLGTLPESRSATSGMEAGPLFWLDTFAIPVRPKSSESPPRDDDDFDELKKRSIRQIRHVFDSSTHAIVIDKDLCKAEAGDRPMEVAMKLLTSSWMRRLWTLQEAFLSKEMSIIFHTHPPRVSQQKRQGWDFEYIMRNLSNAGDDIEADTLKLSIGGILSRQLRENLMVSEREVRNRTGDPISSKGSMLIASAWRSVRWRSTSREEDETLALATLLNLDYRDTGISRAGGINKLEPKSSESIEKRQGMMKAFWELIHRHWEGSIPSGMIFLPPPRLSIPGFGWSPQTWMTGENEDYPYPLARMDYPTQLKPNGLLVRYPGVVLYSSNFASRLANLGKNSFEFPIDRELNEWYSVTAIEKPDPDVIQTIRDAAVNLKAPKRFSLILSRSRPKDRNEVALLVEIQASPWRRKEGDAPHEVHQCRIITRVWIRRVRPKELSSFGVIGELTDDNQHWCVDNFEPRVKSSKAQKEFSADNTTSGNSDPQEDLMKKFLNPTRPAWLNLGRRNNSNAQDPGSANSALTNIPTGAPQAEPGPAQSIKRATTFGELVKKFTR